MTYFRNVFDARPFGGEFAVHYWLLNRFLRLRSPFRFLPGDTCRLLRVDRLLSGDAEMHILPEPTYSGPTLPSLVLCSPTVPLSYGKTYAFTYPQGVEELTLMPIEGEQGQSFILALLVLPGSYTVSGVSAVDEIEFQVDVT